MAVTVKHLPSSAIVTAAAGFTVVSLYVQHLMNVSMRTLAVGPTNLKSQVISRKGWWSAVRGTTYLRQPVGFTWIINALVAEGNF